MDYALPFRRELIANASGRPLTTDEQMRVTRMRLSSKRAAAINRLGDTWVLHPGYQPERHPHHRPSHKDSAVLKRVADAARQEGRL
jgi:hypothetical protein